jgi:hypothetical protein
MTCSQTSRAITEPSAITMTIAAAIARPSNSRCSA